MARDEREQEREFLDRLKAHTGRDLAEWMTAIAAQGFGDKNQTIDWLRAQGLTFQRASRLERIHANGGRPIYEGPAGKAAEPANSPRAPGPQPEPAPPAQAAHAERAADEAAALEKLIASAKGYRPLYHMLEAAIRDSVPALVLTPRAGYISLGAPAEFAAVTLHANEIRLGLDLGDRPFDALLQKSKLKGPGPAITHMAALTDARQVNGELLSLVRAAAERINKRL